MSESKMWLTFDCVTKFYGAVIGVNDVTCRIGPGITGLFGANGAGKSTLMKLASGQLRPSLGEVYIGEHRALARPTAKQFLGFSPRYQYLLRGDDRSRVVEAMARLSGFTAREAHERADIALAETGMLDRAHRRIGGLQSWHAAANQARPGARPDPQVLLLDEPMTGIDPGGRRDLSHLLIQLAERGKTVLVSSHILIEVEQLTESILMIARGRIIASGTLGEVRNLLEDQPFMVRIVAEPPRKLAALLVDNPDV